jgi:hypothetical protein
MVFTTQRGRRVGVAALAILFGTLTGCGGGAPKPVQVQVPGGPTTTYAYVTVPAHATVPVSPTTAASLAAAYRYVGMQRYADNQGEWVTVKYYAGAIAKGAAVPGSVGACSDQQIVGQLVALTGEVVISWNVTAPPMVFSFDPVTTMQPVVPSRQAGVFDTALYANGTWSCSNATYPNQPGIAEPLKGSGTLTARFVSLADIIGPVGRDLTAVERAAWALDPQLTASTDETLELVQPAFVGPNAALCPSLASETVGPWRLGFFIAPPYELPVPADNGRPAFDAKCEPVPAHG